MTEPTAGKVDALYERLKKEASQAGYHLNPDIEFTKDLIKGLLTNEGRYGYWACPCRLSYGRKDEDLDIICPCDYRDADLVEFGACYCALYVSAAVAKGERSLTSIPERRPPSGRRMKQGQNMQSGVPPFTIPADNHLAFPVWRCKVCGYLCARDQPPDICPICKVKRDRFERFI